MARIIKEVELQGQRAVELDAIIGARTMEQWEIKVDPRTGGLDLGGLRRREFTELLPFSPSTLLKE